ncbi:invasion associated locus B family protein [Rhodobacteraceae bacterium NNCM2]|nr:invasion associated locus B family protein [Coraliihabitans acroporae]
MATTALAQQQPEQESRATHGAWEIVCIKGTDNCSMRQIGKSAKGEDALLVTITKVDAKAQDGTAIPATAEIMAPLGVVLPAGIRVQVDGGKVRGTGFQVCLNVGCLAQDAVSDEFLNDLKGGSSAKMILVLPGQGEVAVNISLSGFTKAYGSLKPRKVN